MSVSLQKKLKDLIDPSLCESQEIYQEFLERVGRGNLAEDEDAANHLVAYVIPYDPASGKILLTHHVETGLWMFPGGHVRAGEGLYDAANREVREELGVADFFRGEEKPFNLTISEINHVVQSSCRRHFEIGFIMHADAATLTIDPSEFHEVRWVTGDEARALLTYPAALVAVRRMYAQLQKLHHTI